MPHEHMCCFLAVLFTHLPTVVFTRGKQMYIIKWRYKITVADVPFSRPYFETQHFIILQERADWFTEAA